MSDVDAEFEKACAAMSQEQSPASVAAQAVKEPVKPFTPDEIALMFKGQPENEFQERTLATFAAMSNQINNMLTGNKNFAMALSVLCLRQGGSVIIKQSELLKLSKQGENLQVRQNPENGDIELRVQMQKGKIITGVDFQPRIVAP